MRTRRRAFTLVEMLVVLVILAVVTGIALRSATSLEDRTRMERTLQALAEVRAALVGEGASGFVADLGRLPEPPPDPGPDGLYGLTELFEPLPGTEPIHVAIPESDPEIAVPVGWRGPYLRPPPTGDPGRALDGYGQEIRARVVRQLDGTLLRASLVSSGPNGFFEIDDPAGDDLEEILFLRGDAGEILVDELFCDVTVTVTLDGGLPPGAAVTVFAYGPDGAAGGLAEESRTLPQPGAPVVFEGLPRAAWTFRAYLHPQGSDPRADAQAKSAPLRRALPPRVEVIDLAIVAPAGPEGGVPGGPAQPLGRKGP